MDKELPLITIKWDEKAQGIILDFDPNAFRSWDMVMNVLETALRHSRDQRTVAMMNHVQQQQQEAIKAREIRRLLQR